MIRADVEYDSGVKEFWIAGDDVVKELLRFDYAAYKAKKKTKYYYMGMRIYVNEDFDFIKNGLYVKSQMSVIEKRVNKLI